MAATNRLTPDRLADEVAELVPAGPLVVALGGGADSAVAAWAVARSRDLRGIFVRHGLEASESLERAAEALASELGIDLSTVEAMVESGPSLEERARNERWSAIHAAVTTDETVVTGHTQDDQAETVMMNLLRGAGSPGIAGMLRSRPGVVRPLLGFSRADIRAIAQELGLPFVDDPANEDQSFLRNRMRSNLLPMLESDYRPGIRGVLARAGALAAADDELIETLAERIPIVEDAGAVLVPAAALSTAPRPIAARSVRRTLRRLLAPYAGAETDIEAVLAVADGRTEAAMISGALVVEREGPFVSISSGEVAEPRPVSITVPSEVRFGPDLISFDQADAFQITRRSTLLVDPAVFGTETVLRCASEGERIDINGGTKAVRTALSERTIPVRRRSTWPVVVDRARIAVIVGVRVAPWARPGTDHVIAIGRRRDRS